MRELAEVTLAVRPDPRVRRAPTGAAVLELARGEPVDLVLLDGGLPDMDGFAVCARLRQDPTAHRPRIVMVTGRAGWTDQHRARQLGADAYLVRPFSPSALLGLVEALLAAPPAPARAAVPAA
jgi:DNA-binding response OmpR family regulator